MKLTSKQKSQIEFLGEKRCCSNMWKAEIVLDEKICLIFSDLYLEPGVFHSTEQMYQEMKSLNQEWRNLIRTTETPEKTKKLSRKLVGEGKKFRLREDWDEVKFRILALANFLKYSQHPELLEKLRQIYPGDTLIEERNFWDDVFWGVCEVDGKKVGKNMLGKILMDIRTSGPENFLENLISGKFETW